MNSGMMSQFLFLCSCVGGLAIFYMSLILKSCHYCHMEEARMITPPAVVMAPKMSLGSAVKKMEVTPQRVMLARTDRWLINS
jgi:hypothetical protein